jgi:signal transduction histidine kinase
MSYYNEIYYLLFGIMFVMLAISTSPHYRKDSPQTSHPFLMGVPLSGALAYLLFLAAPHVHRALITPANLVLMAATLGPGFLMRHWLGKDSRKPICMAVVLWVVAGALFEYLRSHGNFQQRVSLVVVWLIVANLWTCLEAYRLQRQRPSFYLVSLIVATLLGVAANVVRLALILSDPPSNINLYEEPILLMLLRFILGVFQIFIVVFLTAHASERLHWAHLAIQQAKDKTESINTELTRLISERDHMLMINSRFSTVSSLAMFNSAIVHELSQPLAALTLTLQETQLRVKDTDPGLQASIDQSVGLVQKIGRMNQSLRNLLMAQKSDHEPVAIGVCIDEMLPILQNETRRRSVQFIAPTQSLDLTVLAHKVLLERIIFNLVANAMDALTGSGAAAKNPANMSHVKPQITLQLAQQTRHGRPHAVLTVQDNGPGFEAHLLAQEWLHFQSTKDSGMGVGLILCHYILSTWNGEMALQNLPTGGACVQLWIPLQSA